MRRIFQHFGQLRGVIAAMVAVSVLAAGWMAASPELHHQLHHDSHESGHECLVTMMSAGGVDHVVDAPPVFTAQEPPAEQLPSLHPQWVLPLFLNGSVLEHAPPAIA